MRVGLSLLTLFPGRVGGSETYVRGLLDQFRTGGGRGAITVLGNRHVKQVYDRFEADSVSIHHVQSYRPGDHVLTRALGMATAAAFPARTARDIPDDLDLIHYAVTVPIPVTGLPTVVTIHDVQHLDLPQLFSTAEKRYRAWAYDGAARAATRVITGSDYSRDRLVERANVRPGNIDVVSYGVNVDRFAESTDERAEALLQGVDLPERFIVYPANMWAHKNHDRLVDALAAVHDRDLTLVLTGQTYGKLERLLKRAHRRGVGERVRHVGFLPGAAVPGLYRRASAMIFPSLYEGFGAPPLESMAAGVPVAASSHGSLAEICGGAALGFDPTEADEIAEAIDRIVSDEPLRNRLRLAGRERVRDFDWSVAADHHWKVYQRALAE